MTSSTTPGIVVNSCCTPWILIAGDGAAFQAGQQDAAQAVADGHAEAALERLGDELAVGVGQRRAVADDPAGQFQSTPSNTHVRGPPVQDQALGSRSLLGCPVELCGPSRRLIADVADSAAQQTSMISCSRMSGDARCPRRRGGQAGHAALGRLGADARPGSRGPAACPSACRLLATSLQRLLAVLDLDHVAGPDQVAGDVAACGR